MFDKTKRIFCVVTGASRGIGRQISSRVASEASRVTFVLIARSVPELNETKKIILGINPEAVIHLFPLDLSNTSINFREILSVFNSEFDSAIIFHNVGSIGQIQETRKLQGYTSWKTYYDLNVFSVTCLNACFLETVEKVPEIFVVNVTSLVGRQPFKYLSMYGSGKAARDLYFKVCALENPKIHVLNYSPGMVETSMAQELVQNIGVHADSEITQAVQENPTKLTPEQTVNKLFTLLQNGKYKSGDVVDYYDDM